MSPGPLIPITLTQSKLLLFLCSPDVATDFLLLWGGFRLLWCPFSMKHQSAGSWCLNKANLVGESLRNIWKQSFWTRCRCERHCRRRLLSYLSTGSRVRKRVREPLTNQYVYILTAVKNVPGEKFTVPVVVKFNAAVVKLNCCVFPERGGFSKKSLLFPSFTNFHNCGLKIMV